jgi:hypothetical protein
MRRGPIYIYIIFAIFLGTGIIYGNVNPDTFSLPISYEGTATIKVTGAYHSSNQGTKDGDSTEEFQETIDQNGKVNALLMGNYLIYTPTIDKPLVTGTVSYNHHIYYDGKPQIYNIAPPQNITVQYSQGAIGLYFDFEKKNYTISMGLGAEGDSTHFDSLTGNDAVQTKKRFELDKVELTLPLPQDIKKLKGSKIITGEFKTPDPLLQILENKKITEITWDFTASPETVRIREANKRTNLK